MPKQKILIVEDAPDIAGLLQIFFSSKNYEAVVATRGAQGLDLSSKERPDLILLDVNLPDMNGFQVCDALRANLRTKHIPIIFLTARGEKSDKIQGFQMGADDYIVKPFDIEELHLRVDRALERASFLNLTNPTTGLPGSKLIEDQLKVILTRRDWALASIGLEHFPPFTEKYGFVAGDNALRFVALFLNEAIDELGGPDDFIGHIGGSDFILATTPDRVRPICEHLIKQFDARIGSLYDYRDRKVGYIVISNEKGEEEHVPLMHLIVGVIDGTKRSFSDIRELTEVAAEVRQKARQIQEGERIAFA
ncbi:MAG: response regulator [Chloroflexia bacterium]|nr:response regulator [Chloroflexia bacterium]